MLRALALGCLAGLLASPAWPADPPAPPASAPKLELVSPAFAPGSAIPRDFTCQGKNLSPALTWRNLPAGTRSLALVVDDPDAPDPAKPKLVWDHWLVFNLSPAATGLPEGAGGPGVALPAGALSGRNSWKKTGYGGPCPPKGRHRYFFKLYALDALLPALAEPTKAELLKALAGHLLGQAELIGTYEKILGDPPGR
jgi:Raf kinase inhibitor-like YbhB/YbcL family protein